MRWTILTGVVPWSKTSRVVGNYFFLRRNLGQSYLDWLRFFLNHRTFMRSERPGRMNKSPAELMTGKPHPHWLELLGFELCRRSPVTA